MSGCQDLSCSLYYLPLTFQTFSSGNSFSSAKNIYKGMNRRRSSGKLENDFIFVSSYYLEMVSSLEIENHCSPKYYIGLYEVPSVPSGL